MILHLTNVFFILVVRAFVLANIKNKGTGIWQNKNLGYSSGFLLIQCGCGYE